jgi:hypothetical protein
VTLPETRTATTPSGGYHLYFEVPDPPIRNTEGASGKRGIGRGLDWRGQGGLAVLPSPYGGYRWAREDGLVPVPAALVPAEVPPAMVGTPAICTELSPYGEAALRGAVNNILAAPSGAQQSTLNAECYSIGTLAGAGGVPVDVALDVLGIAANHLVDYDPARPWRPGEAARHVRRAFADGLRHPRPEWQLPELPEDE